MTTATTPWLRTLVYVLAAAVLIIVPAGNVSQAGNAQGKPFQTVEQRLQAVEAAAADVRLQLTQAQRAIDALTTIVTQPPAPTEAFTVRETGFDHFIDSDDVFQPVTVLQGMPPGKYVIFGKIDYTGAGWLTCKLLAGVGTDMVTLQGIKGSLTLMLTTEFSAGGTAILGCQATLGSGFHIADSRIIAINVADVTEFQSPL